MNHHIRNLIKFIFAFWGANFILEMHVLKCLHSNIFVYCLIFIFVFPSCTDTRRDNPDIVIKNGLIYQQGDSVSFSGLVTDSLQGKKVEYHVLNGKKNGDFRLFFKNGKVEMVGHIKNNLNHGKWIYYYENGNIESEGSFQNDLPSGAWKWYHANGVLKEEGNFKEGKRTGEWISYDNKGTKLKSKIFQLSE
ncbi:MAG: toxin-antitoxin system YwqK family antitoxin [Ignavibacteriaceae bacterium]|nr:toxin-antitoxin system YwqK family antitoxin [Ignavibacteriaceae bacterium]